MISGKCFTRTGADTTFFPKIIFPKIGKNSILSGFLSNFLEYPKEAIYRNIQGKVYCSFDINKEGRVVNLKILKSTNLMLNKGAFNTIMKTDKLWTPPYFEGKKSSMSFVMPITFRLEDRQIPPCHTRL